MNLKSINAVLYTHRKKNCHWGGAILKGRPTKMYNLGTNTVHTLKILICIF